jgi:DNA-binding PadR family transcriptional regulator
MKKDPLTRRRARRVLLALLTDAPELSGYPLSRLAQVGAGHVYIVLDHLEQRGWVTGEWEDNKPGFQSRRRYYQYTPVGRERARNILGIKPYDFDSEWR